MVSLETSQIKRITERFINQSGLFEICADTRYGMDGFFSFRFEITIYSRSKVKKIKPPLTFIGELQGFSEFKSGVFWNTVFYIKNTVGKWPGMTFMAYIIE